MCLLKIKNKNYEAVQGCREKQSFYLLFSIYLSQQLKLVQKKVESLSAYCLLY